jgi:aspartate aminotransferase
LDGLRSEIRTLTLEIVRLAGQRTSLAIRVAEEKVEQGLPLVNKEVERHLRELVIDQCEDDGTDSTFALRLLNQIITQSKEVQSILIEPVSRVTAYDMLVKAKAMEMEGRVVSHLEVGEPDFGPPEAVRQAMAEAVAQGHTHYTVSGGISPLRVKLAQHLSKRHQKEILPEEVIVTVSGRFALYLSISTAVRPGDEVIIFDPSYPAYDDSVRAAGAQPVHISTDLDGGWTPDMGLVEDSINKTTRMIILNSPGNPTGKVLEKIVFKKLVEIAEAHDILVVSDEVYSDFSSSNPTSVLEFPDCSHIYLNSFSKSYGMTGFRLGFAVSDSDTVERMTKLQNLCLTSAPEFIQYAGLAALDCDEDVSQNVATIKNRLRVASKHLADLPLLFIPPEGGFYIFPRITLDNVDGIQFAERLLAEKDVCVVPGTGYGPDYTQFFRISVCQSEEVIVEAVRRMEEVLK